MLASCREPVSEYTEAFSFPGESKNCDPVLWFSSPLAKLAEFKASGEHAGERKAKASCRVLEKTKLFAAGTTSPDPLIEHPVDSRCDRSSVKHGPVIRARRYASKELIAERGPPTGSEVYRITLSLL